MGRGEPDANAHESHSTTCSFESAQNSLGNISAAALRIHYSIHTKPLLSSNRNPADCIRLKLLRFTLLLFSQQIQTAAYCFWTMHGTWQLRMNHFDWMPWLPLRYKRSTAGEASISARCKASQLTIIWFRKLQRIVFRPSQRQSCDCFGCPNKLFSQDFGEAMFVSECRVLT